MDYYDFWVLHKEHLKNIENKVGDKHLRDFIKLKRRQKITERNDNKDEKF